MVFTTDDRRNKLIRGRSRKFCISEYIYPLSQGWVHVSGGATIFPEIPGCVCPYQPAEGGGRTDGFERLRLQSVYPVSARFAPSKSVGTSGESLDLSDDSLISIDPLGPLVSART